MVVNASTSPDAANRQLENLQQDIDNDRLTTQTAPGTIQSPNPDATPNPGRVRNRTRERELRAMRDELLHSSQRRRLEEINSSPHRALPPQSPTAAALQAAAQTLNDQRTPQNPTNFSTQPPDHEFGHPPQLSLATSSSRLRIEPPKFDGDRSNYYTYRFQLNAYCSVTGLGSSSNRSVSQNERLWNLLVTTVSGNALLTLMTLPASVHRNGTAGLAALEAYYEPQRPGHALRLYKEFFGLTLRSPDELEQHIAQRRILVTQLANLGETISESLQTFAFLDNLPASMKAEREAAFTACMLHPSLDTALLTIRSRLDVLTHPTSSTGAIGTDPDIRHSALATLDAHQNTTGLCWNCNQPGHRAAQCPAHLYAGGRGNPSRHQGGKGTRHFGRYRKGKGKGSFGGNNNRAAYSTTTIPEPVDDTHNDNQNELPDTWTTDDWVPEYTCDDDPHIALVVFTPNFVSLTTNQAHTCIVPSNKRTVILDTAATRSVLNKTYSFPKLPNKKITIQGVGNTLVEAHGQGTAVLHVHDHTDKCAAPVKIDIGEAYYMPHSNIELLSMPALYHLGYGLIIPPNHKSNLTPKLVAPGGTEIRLIKTNEFWVIELPDIEEDHAVMAITTRGSGRHDINSLPETKPNDKNEENQDHTTNEEPSTKPNDISSLDNKITENASSTMLFPHIRPNYTNNPNILLHDRFMGASDFRVKQTLNYLSGKVISEMNPTYEDNHQTNQPIARNITADDKYYCTSLNKTAHDCDACLAATMERRRSKKSKYHYGEVRSSSNIKELYHMDFFGPFKTIAVGGKRYALIVVDDYSRFKMIRFAQKKSEAVNLLNTIFTQYGSPYNLRCDNAKEYLSLEMTNMLTNQQVKRSLSPPHNQWANGVAEAAGKELIRRARHAMALSNAPEKLWIYALAQAAYVSNRLITRINKAVPATLWSRRHPIISTLRTFGSKTSVRLAQNTDGKLSNRKVSGIMLGNASLYPNGTYHIYIPSTDRTIIGWDITTEENIYPYAELRARMTIKRTNTNEAPEATITRERLPYVIDIQDSPTLIGRELTMSFNGIPYSGRVTKVHTDEDVVTGDTLIEATFTDGDTQDLNIMELQHVLNEPLDVDADGIPIIKDHNHEVLNVTSHTPLHYSPPEITPTTFHQAMQLPNADRWLDGCQTEMDAMVKIEAFTWVPRPSNKHIIRSKWVFKIKEDGRYRCRWVAQGFSEENPPNDTFAPTGQITTFYLFLSKASKEGRIVHVIDFSVAFLNAPISQETLVEAPPGFEQPGMVISLQKSLYGLKGSPKNWYEELTQSLRDLGFSQGISDPCYFYKTVRGNRLELLCYVDDTIISHPEITAVDEIKKALLDKYKGRDLGPIDGQKFLGIKVEQDKTTKDYSIDQMEYIDELLERTPGLENLGQMCKGLKTPGTPNEQLSKTDADEQCTQELRKNYRSLVGALLYVLKTRYDVFFSVKELARFLENPGKKMFRYAKKILRYLKETRSRKLYFRRQENPDYKVTGFTDANWAGNVDNRKSTSGYIIFVNGTPILTGSKTQHAVSLSSCESELYGISIAGVQMLYLRRLMDEMNMKVNNTPILYGDNQSANLLMTKKAKSQRVKHIDIRYFWTRQCINEKWFKIGYVPSSENVADLMTKYLGNIIHSRLTSIVDHFCTTDCRTTDNNSDIELKEGDEI